MEANLALRSVELLRPRADRMVYSEILPGLLALSAIPLLELVILVSD
jgi:hypothetical protein